MRPSTCFKQRRAAALASDGDGFKGFCRKGFFLIIHAVIKELEGFLMGPFVTESNILFKPESGIVAAGETALREYFFFFFFLNKFD